MHQTKAYEPGDTILSQGETGRGFCILKSGTLEVVKGGKVITELSVPGIIFGEMSDILGEPRISDVRAKDEALVIHIEKSIDELVVEDPKIAKKLIFTLAKRLDQTTGMLENLLPDTDTLSEDHELEILVVDNREAMVEQIGRDLGNRPWQITGAETAGKATEMTKRGNYALIVLSLNLPNPEDAMDFYRALRKNPRTKSTPVLATVVSTDSDMKQRGRNAGMNYFLEKPAEPRQVESAIMQALQLDTTGLYCTITDGVLHISFPADCSEFDKTEIVSSTPSGIADAIDSGIRKAAIDIHQIAEFDDSFKKPVNQLIQAVVASKLQFAIVGTGDQAEELNNDRAEGQELNVFPSLGEAVASIGKEEAATASEEAAPADAESDPAPEEAAPPTEAEAPPADEGGGGDDAASESDDDATG